MRLLRRSHHQIEIMQSRSSRFPRLALSRIRPPRDAGSAFPSVVIILFANLGARRENIKFLQFLIVLQVDILKVSVSYECNTILPSYLFCA